MAMREVNRRVFTNYIHVQTRSSSPHLEERRLEALVRCGACFGVFAEQLLRQITQLGGELVGDGKVLAAHYLENLREQTNM